MKPLGPTFTILAPLATNSMLIMGQKRNGSTGGGLDVGALRVGLHRQRHGRTLVHHPALDAGSNAMA